MSSQWRIISASAVLLLIVAIPFSTPSMGTLQMEEDSESRNILAAPPTSGVWIISDETTLIGETININGPVIIQAGGHLTLQNCIVTMHSQVDWWPREDLCYFEVWKGGYLTLKNTHIMSGTMYRWFIQADGESGVHIEGCHLEGNYPIPDQSFMTGAMINLGGWPTYEPLEYAIIKSNTIENFEGAGIFVQSGGALITDNTIENLYSQAIETYKSPNTVITGNIINNVGIDVQLNTGEPLGGTGIVMSDCDNVTVSYNTITNVGTRGFTWRMDTWTELYAAPTGLAEFVGNTVDGEPILFIQDESDVVVGSGVNEVIIHNSSNVTVQSFNGISFTATFCDDITIKDSIFILSPLEVSYCDNVLIDNNTVSDILFGDSMNIGRCTSGIISNNVVNRSWLWSHGIYLRWSEDFIIEGNHVIDQGRWGISLLDSEGVSIRQNVVKDSGTAGIVCWRNVDAEITGNIVDGITGDGHTFPMDIYVGYSGIDIGGGEGIIVAENFVNDTISDGIFVDVVNDIILRDNSIHNSQGRGIFIWDTINPIISNNYLSNIEWLGVGLFTCNNVTMADNVLENIRGSAIYWHNRFVNSRFSEFNNITLNGNPIELFQDQENLSIGTDIAGAILINCSLSRIERLVGNLVEVHHSNDVMILDCEIQGGGIRAIYGENVTISSCEISNTPLVNTSFYFGYTIWGVLGITVYSIANALVINNKLENTGRGGIDVFHSIPARIIGNEINGSGIEGITLWQTREAQVTGNLVNNSWGHSISLSQVSRSDIYLNQFGFAGNSSAFLIDSSRITWHNGTHGNYWFEYSGEDGNSDGIGDTPFEIDSENSDPYPLVDENSIAEHIIMLLSKGPQIQNVSVAPSVLYSSGNATVNVTAYAEYNLAYVILSYSLDSGLTWTNVTMTFSEGIWTTTMVNLPEGTLLCKIYVIDSLGNYDVRELEEIAVTPFMSLPLLIGVAGIGIVAILALVVIFRRKTVG